MSSGGRRGIAAVLIAILALPTPVAAHAFGARYDLPLPLWLYLTGAGMTVALTFLLLALFARAGTGRARFRGIVIPQLTQIFSTALGQITLRVLATLLFALILVAGFFGQQNPIHNLGPTLVWVIWWVGLAFFVALIGNIWPALNPWTAIYDGVAAALRAGRPQQRSEAWLDRPPPVDVWPSVLLFAVFVWLEIVSDAGERPFTLACLIVSYSILTWGGMAICGRDKWLKSGEAFHQAFALLGRFALFGRHEGQIVLRPFGAGLITSKPVHPSMTAFVILMLSTVTFDGFVETPVWASILDWLSESRPLRPLLLSVQTQGIDLLIAIKTTAFLLFPLAFMAIFRLFCSVSHAFAGPDASTSELANTLVLSLVPIAIAYHIAHYLSYLLLAGQLIIPLASDPFGWGWNLFGTAGRAMDVGIINAATVWYVAIVAIVAGHAIAVWIAHVMALALYGNPRQALLSQMPMLVLMVLYTMTSLWILSQPIVEV